MKKKLFTLSHILFRVYMIHSLSIFLSKFDMLIRSEAGDVTAATAAGELDDEEDRVSSSQM